MDEQRVFGIHKTDVTHEHRRTDHGYGKITRWIADLFGKMTGGVNTGSDGCVDQAQRIYKRF